MLSKVTYGILNTAMPTWGEVLPIEDRWDAINYNMMNWMTGASALNESQYNGTVTADFVTLSSDNWTAEGHTISVDNGAQLYDQYCTTCHAADGQGNGPGVEGNAAGGPAPFPTDMSEAYIMWRIWDGVPGSQMQPFNWLISETEMWDINAYVQQQFTPTGGGG